MDVPKDITAFSDKDIIAKEIIENYNKLAGMYVFDKIAQAARLSGKDVKQQEQFLAVNQNMIRETEVLLKKLCSMYPHAAELKLSLDDIIEKYKN